MANRNSSPVVKELSCPSVTPDTRAFNVPTPFGAIIHIPPLAGFWGVKTRERMYAILPASAGYGVVRCDQGPGQYMLGVAATRFDYRAGQSENERLEGSQPPIVIHSKPDGVLLLRLE
jgi:hypothetical protein